MKIEQEFSKYASEYGHYDIIQQKVAKKLVSHIQGEPKNILDLGCGRGAIAEKIDWKYEHFTGVDFAQGMLNLHLQSSSIECIYGNFNDPQLYQELNQKHFDYIVSSSALQWASDLEQVFDNIKNLNTPIALAIFTSGTFATLHKAASLKPLLRSKEEVYQLQKKYFDADFEVITYKLEFENSREMFRYIKKSGVSGSRNELSYKQTKQLMNEYPLNYLEFEVVFLYTKS